MRFGAAVSAVLLSSVIASTPPAVRIARALAGTCGAASVWLALIALAFAPLAVATVTFRHALAAIRLFDSRAVALGVASAVLWGLSTFFALAGLGAFLRATTHHHGLAGATFAVTGVAVALVLALFTTRFVRWCSAASAVVRWIAVAVVSVAMGVGLASVARPLGHSEAASIFVADLVAFVFAAAFGAGAFPYRSRPLAPLAFAGPPLAAVVLALGLGSVRTSAPLRAAIDDEAPLLSTALPLACAPREDPPAH
jgi:hypothetical protein